MTPLGDQREIVAVHDLTLVRRAELTRQLTRRSAKQTRQLLSIEVDQAASDSTSFRINEIHRIPYCEVSIYLKDPRREKGRPAFTDRANGTRVQP